MIVGPNKKKKWVVDADIKGCFDNIFQNFLMKTIGNFPARKLIDQWLKAGYMEEGKFYETPTWKLVRTVLRGERGRNISDLPDNFTPSNI